jgi:mercuric reductase
VTVLELLPRIAPFEDEEITAALAEYLQEEGLRILTDFQTTQVETRRGRNVPTATQMGTEVSIEAEQTLVSTGRRPNTAGIGLEEAGVKLGENDDILVNEFLQTDNPCVYAGGDVTGRDMFVYVAAVGATLAAENALTDAVRSYDTSTILHVSPSPIRRLPRRD